MSTIPKTWSFPKYERDTHARPVDRFRVKQERATSSNLLILTCRRFIVFQSVAQHPPSPPTPHPYKYIRDPSTK